MNCQEDNTCGCVDATDCDDTTLGLFCVVVVLALRFRSCALVSVLWWRYGYVRVQ